MSKRETRNESDHHTVETLAFSHEASFQESLPEIETLRITVTETEGSGNADFDRTKSHVHTTRVYGINVGEHIDCHSPFCVNGGFSISEILKATVRSHEHTTQGMNLCQGSGGAAIGRVKNLPCNHRFQFRISVKYKDETTQSIDVDAYQTRYKKHEKDLEVSWFKQLPPPSQQL